VLKKTDKTIGAVYCGYEGWNSPENNPERYPAGDLTREILLLEYQKHYLHTNTATYKREAILNINGFDESYRRHQDLEFNLRFFEQYKIATVNDILVKINPEATPVNNRVYNLDMVKIKEKFLNQFSYLIETQEENIATQIHNVHLKEAKLFVTDKDAFLQFRENNPGEGFIHLLKSIIQEEEYEKIQNDYRNIMDSASLLLGTSLKKNPIRKLLAYKSLAHTFSKLQENNEH
jgi:hypothetical protein